MRADNTEDVIAAIRVRLTRYGMGKRVAHDLGVSRAFMSSVLHGRRTPSPRMAERLGFRKVVRWERIG